jgi:hypothetical protein
LFLNFPGSLWLTTGGTGGTRDYLISGDFSALLVLLPGRTLFATTSPRHVSSVLTCLLYISKNPPPLQVNLPCFDTWSNRYHRWLSNPSISQLSNFRAPIFEIRGFTDNVTCVLLLAGDLLSGDKEDHPKVRLHRIPSPSSFPHVVAYVATRCSSRVPFTMLSPPCVTFAACRPP